LCAGFPCQPFSIAGKRMGFNDSRGTMFFEVARIIKYTKPKVAFLENVSGIVSHDSGRTIKVITNTLNELGYVVNTKVMNAKDYGIPQNRNRWYCVAIRKDLYTKDFKFPDKKDLEYTLKDIIKKKSTDDYNSSPTAISNINKFITEFKNSTRYEDNGNYIIANEIRASKCNFRNDGISPCLTAKMGTGGNNIPVVVEYKRKLTEKECLRIMGFPETYKIKKNNMQSYKQIGNSVVVPVINDIAKKIVEYL
jgi:DNA (cytosine-5)-methyltransferase 1